MKFHFTFANPPNVDIKILFWVKTQTKIISYYLAMAFKGILEPIKEDTIQIMYILTFNPEETHKSHSQINI